MPSDEELAIWEKVLQDELMGRELTSVEFVQDYLQLRLHGPSISALTWPTIERKGRSLGWNDLGFRAEICTLINEKVTAAHVIPRERFELTFSNEATFFVSLREEDYVTVEAMHFQSVDSSRSWQL